MNLATPNDLYQAPELAILAALDQLLQQCVFALFAAHPELTDDRPFHLREQLTAEIWVADAIYNQAIALQHTIEQYRNAIEHSNRVGNISKPQQE